MSNRTWKSCLIKKTRVKKSSDTVPLNALSNGIFSVLICYVAGSIPAVTPRYCTKKIEKCSLEHKKNKGKKFIYIFFRLLPFLYWIITVYAKTTTIEIIVYWRFPTTFSLALLLLEPSRRPFVGRDNFQQSLQYALYLHYTVLVKSTLSW
jgi:hypothetical protein